MDYLTSFSQLDWLSFGFGLSFRQFDCLSAFRLCFCLFDCLRTVFPLFDCLLTIWLSFGYLTVFSTIWLSFGFLTVFSANCMFFSYWTVFSAIWLSFGYLTVSFGFLTVFRLFAFGYLTIFHQFDFSLAIWLSFGLKWILLNGLKEWMILDVSASIL